MTPFVDDSPQRGGRGRRLPLLFAACALTLGLAHALLNPYLQAPDELAHVDLIHALAEGETWPGVADRDIDDVFFGARAELGWEKYTYARSGPDAPARGERSSLDEFPDRPDIDVVNPATQHPPLYYVAVASVSEAVAPIVFAVVDNTADRTLSLQRLVNVVALALAAYLTVAAVDVLGGGRRSQLLAGGMFLLLPQLVYIGAAVNNDNGLLLGFAATLALGARIATGDTGTRRAVLLGVVAAATAATKSFGVVAVGWAPLFYVPAWVRLRGGAQRVWRSALVATSVGVVLGGAWWVANLLRYGTVQPRALEKPPRPPLEGYDHGLFDWLGKYLPNKVQSFVGDFGYLDAPVPSWIAWLVAAAGMTMLVWAVVVTWRRPRSQRWHLLLLVPFILVASALAAFNYVVVIEELGGRIAGAQGRYLFGAVPPAVALVGLALGRRTRWLPGVVVVAAVAMQVIGLWTVLRAFYAGNTAIDQLRAAAAWAPWHPAVSVGAAVLVAAALAALVRTALVDANRRGSAPVRLR